MTYIDMEKVSEAMNLLNQAERIMQCAILNSDVTEFAATNFNQDYEHNDEHVNQLTSYIRGKAMTLEAMTRQMTYSRNALGSMFGTMRDLAIDFNHQLQALEAEKGE